MEHPFFPTTTQTRFESLRLLSLAETHLTSGDLPTAKSFATRARDTDPSTLPLANQLLAVIDTLLCSNRRVVNNLPDFYAILNLSPHHGQLENYNVLISEQFKSLIRLLHPSNNKYQFADVAFRSVLQAYDVLSNPVKKPIYDRDLAFYLQHNSVNNGFNSGFGGGLGNNNNFARGFSAFATSTGSSSNAVYSNAGQRNDPNLVEVENGTQSFMGILGINSNVTYNDHVQGFSAFVSGGNTVPVVEGNVTDGDLANGGELYVPFVSVVDGNQDRVKETNVGYANAGEVNVPDVNVVEENQDTVKETNVVYSNAGEVNGPGVNVFEEYTFKETNVEYSNVDEINGPDVNGDGLDVEEVVEEEKEEETRVDETGNGGVEATFWTACPYCCCMFEYPGVYVDCCMRCQSCKSAFQGVAIASAPPIVKGEDGKEGYYCCWRFFPVGIRGEIWEKSNEGISGWTPFSPMFVEHGTSMKRHRGNSSGPSVYVDDEDDDVDYEEDDDVEDDEAWMESSESEELDDVDWNKENKKRKVLNTRVTKQTYKIAQKVQVDKCSGTWKKRMITPTRMQPSRAAKKSGKLDLNVECSSNEVEEPHLSGGREEEEDKLEGNGLFEGLDEYLSNIHDGVEGGDKEVKVA